MRIKNCIVLCIFLFSVLNSYAQDKYTISFIPDKSQQIKFNYPAEATDSSDVIEKLKTFRTALIGEGYLLASADSIVWGTETALVYFSTGQEFSWGRLKPGQVPEEFLSSIGFRDKIYNEKPFSPRSLSRLMEKLLSYSENNGFPFARLSLDSIKIDNNKIEASLNLEKNNFTTVDSIIIKGNSNTKRQYILSYLGIKQGMVYSEETFSNIPNRLRELPFIQVIKPYEMGFKKKETDIYLYIDDKKASRFDGILGVLPDAVTGEVLITGDIELNLLNALKRGEKINLNWQKLQSNTQELEVEFNYPFLFGSLLGTDLVLNLYRRDTLFSQVNLNAALQYLLSGGNYFKVFIQNNQSNVLSDIAYTQGNFADTRSLLYGVGLLSSRLDYRFNPTKGYFADISVAAGKKKILVNPELDEDYYDDMALNSTIYNLTADLQYYFLISSRSVIQLQANNGFMLNENMFRNEMFRIGGLKTLRGFDEQAIFASAFAIATVEYRYILEQNSNFFVFFDAAYYEDRSVSPLLYDFPYGFGGGVNFETKAGIFSLTYALGKQFDNPIEFKAGKIHFGFINFF